MPRKARITAPGIVHHIMARGLDGIDIFRKDNDRHFFLTQLWLISLSCLVHL